MISCWATKSLRRGNKTSTDLLFLNRTHRLISARFGWIKMASNVSFCEEERERKERMAENELAINVLIVTNDFISVWSINIPKPTLCSCQSDRSWSVFN